MTSAMTMAMTVLTMTMLIKIIPTTRMGDDDDDGMLPTVTTMTTLIFPQKLIHKQCKSRTTHCRMRLQLVARSLFICRHEAENTMRESHTALHPTTSNCGS